MRHIVEIGAADTHPLRRRVLRDGTASDQAVFDGDDLPTTFHLGVRDDERGTVLAISTWIERPHPALPGERSYQLRGMATDPTLRRTGLGSALLHAGLAICAGRGATTVWARARVSALDFYLRHGFEPLGDEYVDETTRLPHVDIVTECA